MSLCAAADSNTSTAAARQWHGACWSRKIRLTDDTMLASVDACCVVHGPGECEQYAVRVRESYGQNGSTNEENTLLDTPSSEKAALGTTNNV